MKIIAWTKDRKALKAASSGGVFLELAKHFIKNGGLVCGVIMEGLAPEYHITDKLETIKKMRGSKYLWANPMTIYEIIEYDIIKEMDHNILFVGLPCQVLGLKRYLKNRNLSDKFITYISLRCHGVIQTKIFNNYINWLTQSGKNPVSKIVFRSKIHGWQGAGFGFNGGFFKPKLIKDYIKRRNVPIACKNCTKDRNDSDITLGDAWGIHPALKNKYGTSIMKINTWKGYTLFKSMAHRLHWNFVPSVIADIPVDSDKIGLMKVADIKNFGNLMLSSNFISYTKKINKHAKFVFIEEDSAQDIIEAETGLMEDIDYRSIKQSPVEFFKRLVNPEESNLVQTFADCKHVAVLGGDYLTNKWKYRSWISNLVMLNALNKCGKQVHIVSNTVGPFPLLLKPFVKFVFNNLKSIWCRDRDSQDRCWCIGVKNNLYYAPDLAFLPLHNELKYDMLEKLKKTYCTIVISGLWNQYAHTYKEYVNGVKRIARKLYDYTGKDIMIISHSKSPADIQLAEDIVNEEENIYFGSPLSTPSSVRNILGNSYLNVSFRMHGAISSLVRGVPVVAIAYSEKYKGVISDGYKLPELVVNKHSRRDWNYCVKETMGTLWYVLKHRGTITRQINKVNDEITVPGAIMLMVRIMEDKE